jgi:hypothetical protein
MIWKQVALVNNKGGVGTMAMIHKQGTHHYPAARIATPGDYRIPTHTKTPRRSFIFAVIIHALRGDPGAFSGNPEPRPHLAAGHDHT